MKLSGKPISCTTNRWLPEKWLSSVAILRHWKKWQINRSGWLVRAIRLQLYGVSINNKNRTIYYEAAKEYMNRYPSLFENFVEEEVNAIKEDMGAWW